MPNLLATPSPSALTPTTLPTMTLDTAFKEASDFDPWATVPDDPPLYLPPDMYAAPTKPPPDSAFAPLPGADHATPPPWFRDVANGETTKQHNAFRHYLALGPTRSLKQAANELNVPTGTLSPWSARFNWVKRASAFDTYQNEQYEKELANQVRETAKRHARIFSQALDALSTAFGPLSDPEAIAKELNELPVKERLRLATQAAKAMPALATAERLSLGMPSEHTTSSETVTIHREVGLGELKEVLGGLMEAGVLDKEASRRQLNRGDDNQDSDIIDAEVLDDDED